MKPALSAQQEKFTSEKNSRLKTYREYVVGSQGTLHFAYYELCTLLFGGLPGLLGFGARSICYPPLFERCGRKVAFGKNLIIRGPKSITLGNKVLIDDFASVEARGNNASVSLGDFVSIGRFTTVAAKGGSIVIEAGANIGSYCRVATNSRVQIGESALIAAYCYIGPGNHRAGEDGKPLISSEMEIKDGVRIGAHSWIGAKATILDGVSIGERAIVGAHSLVRDDVPDGAVVAGTPARIISK
ncbi:MAG: acyltransferase [Deltaproteobacteria bacterium]|nr:acyltransferase [Deltaproteobacteria bacterium]